MKKLINQYYKKIKSNKFKIINKINNFKIVKLIKWNFLNQTIIIYLQINNNSINKLIINNKNKNNFQKIIN